MSDHSELIARAEQAQEGVTEGPWKSRHAGGMHYGVSHSDYDFPTVVKAQVSYDGYGSGSSKANAEFIAAARDLIPELVAALKESQERLREADEQLDLIADVADSYRLIEDTQILDILRPVEGAQMSNKRVGCSVVGDIVISTVWLGLDHDHYTGVPIIFETMTFGEPWNNEMERYSTEEDAMRGHLRVLERLRAGKPPFAYLDDESGDQQ